MKQKVLLTLALIALASNTLALAEQTNKINKADQTNQTKNKTNQTNAKDVISNEEKIALLAKEKKCFTCHADNRKMVGPSFSDIRQKYEKKPDAINELSIKIRKGSSGAWGKIPMPPSPNVSENEAKILAKWILKK